MSFPDSGRSSCWSPPSTVETSPRQSPVLQFRLTGRSPRWSHPVNQPPPDIRVAGLGEQGAVCLHCRQQLSSGDQSVTCGNCGSVHHFNCWKSYGHCGSYECAPSRAPSTSGGGSVFSGTDPIRITGDDLDHAKPLPPTRPLATGPAISIPVGPDPQALRWNKLAIVSLVVAIIGIPLYGFVTGLVALAMGCHWPSSASYWGSPILSAGPSTSETTWFPSVGWSTWTTWNPIPIHSSNSPPPSTGPYEPTC